MSIDVRHHSYFTDRAIPLDLAESVGVYSTDSALVFPWQHDGAPVLQYRDDKPRVDDDGRVVKYRHEAGAGIPFNKLRDGEQYGRVIVAEGTGQQLAVLAHAPAEYAVYGMSGCWGFKDADLSIAYGRDVFMLLDADFATNPKVYAAADQLSKQMTKNGAKSVRFVSTTGTGTQGVDDVLASLPESRRGEMLRLWLSQATAKLGKRPKAEAPDADASKYFKVQTQRYSLQPMDFVDDLMSKVPCALTPEQNIAMYKNGVYRVDENVLLSHIVDEFGNYFTPSILKTIEGFMRGRLTGQDRVLPERATAPLLNCRNTMVDLRDGETMPHNPDYFSSVQVQVDYDESATCPTYEEWLRRSVRREGMTEADVTRVIAGLEEIAGSMLDPTRTPSKALFLFGPSRSGKSTFLRLLKAVAGAQNTSAVTLHDLANNGFAAANLYGRMLNVAADLSNAHVKDLSSFKMLTGEDVVYGNRKYGRDFEFTNQALIAFSANELPTVSEASRAYTERMWPVEFPNSFAGAEDKTMDARLLAELPGILVRWVKAYQRWLKRGTFDKIDAGTRRDFEAKSDRVAQFFQDMCTLTEASFGQVLDSSEATGRRDVARLFNEWAERNGSSKMGERAFFQRFAQLEGITEVRFGKSKSKGFNVAVAKASDDNWDEEPVDDVVADEIEPSGVSVQDFLNVPQTGAENVSEAAAEPCPVPAAGGLVCRPMPDVNLF